MVNRQGRQILGVAQVSVEIGKIGAEQQTLVNDGAGGEGGHVGGEILGSERLFHRLTGEVEGALERLIGKPGGAGEDGLADVGHRSAGALAEGFNIHWYVAPGQERDTALTKRLGDDGTRCAECGFGDGEEKHAEGEIGGVGGNALGLQLTHKEVTR